MRVFGFRVPHPGPAFEQQSVNVWPARRWAQYETTFRAWSVTLHRLTHVWFGEEDFFFFNFRGFPGQASEIKFGRLAGQTLVHYEMLLRFRFCFWWFF